MVKKIKNTPFWNVLRRGSALTLALIVVAMSCFVPISAADEPTEPTEPVYSEGLTYTFSGSNATVTGPGTWAGGELRIPRQVTVDGVTYTVTAIGSSAFMDNTDVVSLVMPITVVSLGQRAFQGCVNLTSVSGGSNIASTSYCFDNCVRLRNFDFSGFKTITASYFLRGTQVKTIVIPSTCSQFSLSSLGDFEYLFYSSGSVITGYSTLPSSCQELHFDGTLKEYVQSFTVQSSSRFFQDQTRFFLSGVEVTGTLRLPDSVTITTCFSGLTSIDTLIVPSTVSFSWYVSGTSAYICYFSYCKNLKIVYWNNSASYAMGSSANYQYLFQGCVSLEKFYYNGTRTSLRFKDGFSETNSTFTLYLPGASDDYTLTGFSNPIVYDSVFVTPDFQYLYTDSNIITNKGGSISATLQAVKNYRLPDTVDVTDTSGTSLGWTNGVEYTYNSTTGQFTVPALNQNIQLHAVGVSLVSQYYFFNETPQFNSFVGDQFTFEATDFYGAAATGAFIRLEGERLCFYQIVAEEDVLAWADDTGWVSPLYRYLDFGSYEVGEDLAYFLRTTASVPSIGSMLSQIYNASGGGSSGGSYDTGYVDGYQIGFNDGRDVGYADGYTAGYNEGYNAGYAAGSSGAGTGSGSGAVDSVFALATYRLDLVRDGQVVHSMNVTPQYNLGSVYFGALDIVNAIYDYEENNGDLDRVNVVCTWADSDAFDFGQFPLYISGTSLVETGALLTSDDVSLSLAAPWVDGYSTQDLRRFEITSAEIPTVVLVKSISISVGRPQDLLKEFTLCTSTYFYNQGYNNGYTVGYGVGSSEVRAESYNTGYHNGFIEGKSEGITIAEKGNFYNLFFSVSDAVYSNFLNLLNFEVLGVNMKVVFGSFLTVCLVLIVIFKFTGKN